MTDISTIFFDLDNTLVDYYGSDLTGMTALQEQFFPELTLKEFRDAWRTANIKNWALFEKGELTIEGQRVKRVQETWSVFNKDLSEPEAKNIFELYLEVFKNSVQALPFAVDVLKTLHQRGYPIGIITNGGSIEQRRKLKEMKLEEYLQPKLIFISEEVGVNKPNLEIFNKAQVASGSQPENILYVGDTFTHDIQPARSLNWQTMLIDHYNFEFESVKNETRSTDLRDVLKVAR